MGADISFVDQAGAPAKKPSFFYGYVIVICSFLIMFTSFGVNYSFGIFFNLLLADFGWSRVETAMGYSFGQIFAGLLGIFIGRITDSIGPRLIGLVCGLSLGAGCILMSLITGMWQFYLIYGILFGIGMGGTYVPLASTVSRWFVRRRGFMIGILVSGVGTATIIFPMLVSFILSFYSWRTSFLIVGVLALLLIIPAALFLRRDPGVMGESAYGQNQESGGGSPVAEAGLSFREAVATDNFWMVCAIYFLVGYFSQAVIVHIVPYAKALGIAVTSAAAVLSLVGAGSIAGRIIMGSISDKIGVKASLIISLSIPILTFIWLQSANEMWMLYLFAPTYGFAYGALMAMMVLTAAMMFGLPALGVIIGVISFMYSLGGAAGPAMSGYLFDITGSYNAAFLVCAMLAALGLGMAIILRRPRPVGKD